MHEQGPLPAHARTRAASVACVILPICEHCRIFLRASAQVRTLIQREMGAALQQYDALLCPAAPTPAYRLGEKTSDPLAMYKGEGRALGEVLAWEGLRALHCVLLVRCAGVAPAITLATSTVVLPACKLASLAACLTPPGPRFQAT